MTRSFPPLLLPILLLLACSRMEESEKDLIRKANETSEKIYRFHDDYFFVASPPKLEQQEKYPWERSISGSNLKITKEYFRCKGSSLNLPKETESGILTDCNGIDDHGLPYRDGKEYIYPILIDLLNYVQEKTGKKVILTAGHRCPKHNTYAEPTRAASKHQIGAEVDFYVEEYENRPIEIIKILMQFYQEKGNEAFCHFVQKEKRAHQMRWHNKEITIALTDKDSGRDFDNRHPYPYITIELCFDRFSEKTIEYTWQKAHNGYLRT